MFIFVCVVWWAVLAWLVFDVRKQARKNKVLVSECEEILNRSKEKIRKMKETVKGINELVSRTNELAEEQK